MLEFLGRVRVAAAAESADAAVVEAAADSYSQVVGLRWWNWPLPAALAAAATTGSMTATARMG